MKKRYSHKKSKKPHNRFLLNKQTIETPARYKELVRRLETDLEAWENEIGEEIENSESLTRLQEELEKLEISEDIQADFDRMMKELEEFEQKMKGC